MWYKFIMWHVANILLFALFTSSLVFAFITGIKWRHIRIDVWAYFRNYYISFIFLAFLNLFAGYLAVIFNHSWPQYIYQVILPCLHIGVNLVLIINFRYLLFALCAMNKIVYLRKWDGFLVVLSFLVILAQSVGFAYHFMVAGLQVKAIVDIILNSIILIPLIFLSVKLILSGLKAELKPGINIMLKTIGGIYSCLLSLNLVLIVLAELEILKMVVIVSIFSVTWMVINSLPVVFINQIDGLCRQESDNAEIEIKDHLKNKYGITNREYEIICLIMKGKANKEISDELFISLQTVKDHNSRIFKKLNVSNRVQLNNCVRQIKEVKKCEDYRIFIKT